MIDTGAVVSPMSAQEHKKYFSHIRLVQSHLVIQNYSEQVINYLGFFKASITWVFFKATIQYQGILHRSNSTLLKVALPSLDLMRSKR